MPTILITGANRGIGLALTQSYLSRGDDVIATCRAPEKATALQALSKQHSGLTILPLEVTDPDSIAHLVATLGNRPIDILINNAGVLSGSTHPFTSLDIDPAQTLGTIDAEEWDTILRINTIAPIMVTQALLPNLKQAMTRKIAMISSGSGSITKAIEHDYMAYGSSKAALNYAMKSVSFALQKDGFVVVSLNPGWVKTDMGSCDADLTPQESAARLMRVIDTLTPEQTGQFIRHTGELIPW
ncbi:MAG TPA: short-chain dehydrogenase [Rhodospirillaceae bacterium]|nr:short-chain dehydrogenase [Rhodospirillaceae bacterium]